MRRATRGWCRGGTRRTGGNGNGREGGAPRARAGGACKTRHGVCCRPLFLRGTLFGDGPTANGPGVWGLGPTPRCAACWVSGERWVVGAQACFLGKK